ncbi:hypothetical protein Tco_0937182 [Tanacetum coccineum]|uniref:Uncharacterized protein n=1 Tax=Tanacetum coccineum TaxID=301880 RepID=A0ABQ5DED0_9ASTR
MGDENPIRTLGDYSKPSHEGYMNTIELPVGNNVLAIGLNVFQQDPSPHGDLTTCFLAQIFPPRNGRNSAMISMFQTTSWESLSRQGLVSRTYYKKSIIMESIVGFKSKFFKIMSPFILSARLTALPAAKSAIRIPMNLGKSLSLNPQPQALGTTFEARVRDYMAAHTKRMDRFENSIFKQREEMNSMMTEMFWLLKELTTSRAPEKVLIREEAKSTITKSVNSISLIREEEEKNDIHDVATSDDSKETDVPDIEVSVKEAKTKNGAENRAKNKPIKTPKKEEVVEAPSSWPVEYYLKHGINEKLIEGLVDNNRFNDSLSGARAGKKNGKTYNVLPRGPVYEAILKKKITKNEDIGGNFEIPCIIGGLKNVNALVDQGSAVNVMPYSTYMKLTNERPAKT